MRSFLMYNSRVEGAVRLGRAVIEEDLSLYDSFYEGPVILFGTNVGGNFFAANSQFNGTEADSDTAFPFELWKTHVAQTTEFRNATIKGDAMFEDANFDGNLVLNNAVFERTANFKDFHVGNFVEAKFTVFKDAVSFESGIVDRDANFSNAIFGGNVNFDYFTVDRFIDFDEAVFNSSISFKYAEAGWVDFSKAAFNEKVDFTGIQVSNKMNFSDSNYTFAGEAFSIGQAEVQGEVIFNNFNAPAGLNLTNDQFGGLEISSGSQPFAVLNLSSSESNGSLYIHNTNVQDFLAVEFTADESTTFQELNISNTLDMSNASIGFFTMDGFT